MDNDLRENRAGGTMDAQEESIKNSLAPGADPERLRFGAAPPAPADTPGDSTIAPSPLDRPVGPAAANQDALRHPDRPDPTDLRNVEAGTDVPMRPPTVRTGPSGAPVIEDPALGSGAVTHAPAVAAHLRSHGPEAAPRAGGAGNLTPGDLVEARTLVGMPVVDLAHGREAGHIKDILFDPQAGRLGGFMVGLPGLLAKSRLLAWNDVHAIGQDAVTIANGDRLESERREGAPESERGATVSGKRLLSANGRNLGTVEDLVVNRKTGEVVGYRMAGDAPKGGDDSARYLLNAETIAVGDDVITVPAYAEGFERTDLDGLARDWNGRS